MSAAIRILKHAIQNLQSSALSSNEELKELRTATKNKEDEVIKILAQVEALESSIKKLEGQNNVTSKNKKTK